MNERKLRLNNLLPFLGLALVVLLLALATGGRLLNGSNLNIILNQSHTVMLVAVGITLVYAHGGIDFSVGAVMALSEMCAVLLYRAIGQAWILAPVAIVAAIVCNFVTASIIIKLNVPPFIASLCMQFVCRGILNTVVNTQAIGVNEFAAPGWEQKLPVLIIAIAAMWILLNYTKIGKYNKAIGENIRTVRTSGVNVNRYRMYAYLISGVTLGLAAYFDVLRSGALSNNACLNLEMDVIIALVLGGLSLSGGYSSSVRCAILGSLIIVVMTNGLTLLGVNSQYMGIIKGLAFLGIVLVTYRRNKSVLLPR